MSDPVKKTSLKNTYGIPATNSGRNPKEAEAFVNFMMDEGEVKEQTIKNMEDYGGSFVKSLAECFRHADPENTLKLAVTFSNYLVEYEPTKWRKTK